MKKLISLILSAVLLLASFSFAAAEDDYYTDAKTAADYLYSLSLFEGTSKNAEGVPNYSLDKIPTREQAITMLIRMLGKEQEAVENHYPHPFQDVSPWADDYVGYAYEYGLTSGTSATIFSYGDPNTPASATMYLSYVLRALGYDDDAGDFKWYAAWELSDELGFTKGEFNKDTNDGFLRSGMVLISANALAVKPKHSSRTLYAKLDDEGAIALREVPGSSTGSGTGDGSESGSGAGTEQGKEEGTKPEPEKTKGSVTLGKAEINGRNASIAMVDMTGRKGFITLAGDSVTLDMPYQDHIDQAAALAGEQPALSVNGTYFNAYYKTNQELRYPDNCANIEQTVLKDGRVVMGGGSTKVMSLGFDAEGHAMVGKVSFSPEVSIAGMTYVPWAVNQYYSDEYAVMLFTGELYYPVEIPSDAKIFWIKDETVIDVQSGGGSITVPEGSCALVFQKAAYASALKWNENLKKGTDAVISVKIAADDPIWQSCVDAVAGNPALVENGADITSEISGVEDKLLADTVAQRSFAAEMKDGRLLIGTAVASPAQLAEYLVSAGAKNAVCLDGGASSALDVNGIRITSPGRKLTNVIHIY
ncbi:MAG: phosphodiester glycosidase family protein [Firmicutes bacterium]|nr:phosphodiester glycosidase family protein [Bacillota bacterium]